MGLDNLYRYAKEARRIFSSKLERNAGRIITRPYIGENGNYTRTFNRHDYSVMPSKKTILDKLREKKYWSNFCWKNKWYFFRKRYFKTLSIKWWC